MGHLHTPAMLPLPDRRFKLSQRVEYRQLSTANSNRSRTKEVEHSKTSAAGWVVFYACGMSLCKCTQADGRPENPEGGISNMMGII